jgi:hypothetical protein
MEAMEALIERETETERRRRGVVEEVCSPFVALAYTVRGYQILPGTVAAAKRHVQEELARAGRGRSRDELVKLAAEAREQVYAPVLKAQDDARVAAARAAAERKAHLAQEREEARRREQVAIPASPQGTENSEPVAHRVVEERDLTDGTAGGHELEDDTEDDFDDEPEGNETDDDEPDGDTELEGEPEDEEESAPVGWGTFLALGAIALGVAVLSTARRLSRAWIADPHNGGDGSFEVSSVPPGPEPPWRVASQREIQQGLQSGAFELV